jgi:hypothetical protein
MNSNAFKVTKKYVEDDDDRWLVSIAINGKKYPRKHGHYYCYPKTISKKSALDNGLIAVGLDVRDEDLQANVERMQKSLESERKLNDQINQLRRSIATYDSAIAQISPLIESE